MNSNYTKSKNNHKSKFNHEQNIGEIQDQRLVKILNTSFKKCFDEDVQ